MKKLSKNTLLKTFLVLLVLLLITKTLSLALWWYLPSDGVNFKEKKNYNSKYVRVDFKNMISSPSTQKVVTPKKEILTSDGISITNMLLKGLYGQGESGFAIVALKSTVQNTVLVSIGDIFEGYKLKEIRRTSVIFTKYAKEYVLNMKQDVQTKKKNINYVKPVNTSSDFKNVSRNDIQLYAKNPDKIWKDISIVPMKNHQGFKITRVRRGSKMDALGLHKGDIMIRANNADLKSYKDAINLYKHINTMDVLELVVLRNNQEKEFIYEIN